MKPQFMPFESNLPLASGTGLLSNSVGDAHDLLGELLKKKKENSHYKEVERLNKENIIPAQIFCKG